MWEALHPDDNREVIADAIHGWGRRAGMDRREVIRPDSSRGAARQGCPRCRVACSIPDCRAGCARTAIALISWGESCEGLGEERQRDQPDCHDDAHRFVPEVLAGMGSTVLSCAIPAGERCHDDGHGGTTERVGRGHRVSDSARADEQARSSQ